MTCVHLLPQAKFELKDSSIQQKIVLYAAFKPPYLSMYMRQVIFMKRPKFLAASYNLLVEQNLVHLSRFLHFSQNVVQVTLNWN